VSSEAPSLGGAAGSGEQPRLRWLREVWASTLGKKIIVAMTGVLLAGYVILHALGNLKGLQGPGDGDPAIDKYAEFLRTIGGPAIPRSGLLWIIRGILILALVIHIVGVTQLIKRNRAARPESARVVERSLSSRTMAYSGFLLLAFIIFHVLQFTTLTIHRSCRARSTRTSTTHSRSGGWSPSTSWRWSSSSSTSATPSGACCRRSAGRSRTAIQPSAGERRGRPCWCPGSSR
jgi:hypothetical protein